MNSPLLLQRLAPIKRKIVAAFSESYRPKISSLRRRILVGKPASEPVLASFLPPQPKALTGIAEAFFNMSLSPSTMSTGTARPRRVMSSLIPLPQCAGMVPLGMGPAARAVRYFRIDRIKSVTPLEAGFRPADPRPFLAEAEEGIEAL